MAANITTTIATTTTKIAKVVARTQKVNQLTLQSYNVTLQNKVMTEKFRINRRAKSLMNLKKMMDRNRRLLFLLLSKCAALSFSFSSSPLGNGPNDVIT